MKFIKTFKQGQEVYLEDSVLWYALQSPNFYLKLNVNQRINFKQSYFVPDSDYPY